MPDTTDKPLVYLIDASVYVFRAWHSIPDRMRSPAGEPTNAVYGFARFLADLLSREATAPVAVAFDESLTTSYRNEIYPEYKANRPPAPEALKRQFAWCQSLCSALDLPWLAHPRFEADDIIGTWTVQARAAGFAAGIVTRDKDLAQLLEDQDHLWDFAGDVRLDAAGVEAKMGVRPDQVADFLALTGDAVDNIPGIPGVGPKAAVGLLQAFGSLDGIYARLQEVPGLPLRGAKSLATKLVEHEELARLSRRLTGIPTDIDLPALDFARRPPAAAAIADWASPLGFGDGLRRALHGASRD